MADNRKKMVPIDYTNREFNGIRDDLMEIVERFYPDKFRDWSEGSFGSLMLDAVAYVGDQLSFYLDYNVNETFLDTAYQYGNILRQGRVLGYKSTGRPSTYGIVAMFVLVPASPTAIGPDTRYIPILKRGTSFLSRAGLSYILTQNIDFSNVTYPRVVARVNDDTGSPTHYAIKAYGNVVSGQLQQEEIDVGPYERFKRVAIADPNVSEVIKVVDTEGNEYFEVDYLSQDMIYKEISNKNFLNDNVPSILKPTLVSRKFVVERGRESTIIQFGSGKEGESSVVASPQEVAIDLFGKNYTTDVTFDPTRLSKNENFGIVPSNTTLTVVYRSTNPVNSNAGAGSINKVTNAIMSFSDRQILSNDEVVAVRNSIEVFNESPITGDVTAISPYELKQRIYDTFPTQNRAVTQSDYENIALRMPAKFGSVSRVSVQKDPSAKKRNLNMYIVSEDLAGKLTLTNQTIKNNLKVWLNNYRMINDTIDILDPYIINIGIFFDIKASAGAEKFDTLQECIDAITKQYSSKFFIGESLYVSDIYKALNEVPGVLDVISVKLLNKIGSNYSGNVLDIKRNMSPDGGHLVAPKNAILEIKFPEVDIKGKVR
jgi:hypothetical protein